MVFAKVWGENEGSAYAEEVPVEQREVASIGDAGPGFG